MLVYIRFIVGSGLIRNEVLLAQHDSKFRGDVRSFELEFFNVGAVLARLK